MLAASSSATKRHAVVVKDEDSIPNSDDECDDAFALPQQLPSATNNAAETESALLERLVQQQGFQPLTDEQRAILLHEPRAGAHIVVNACAGTGKTTMARLIAERFRHWRILYVVFNKAAQEEAAQKMPPHVDCRTTHSLALLFAKSQTMPQRRNAIEIDKRGWSTEAKKWAVVRTLDNFCADGSRAAIDAAVHCPSYLQAAESRAAVAHQAQQAWDRVVVSRGGQNGWPFPALLKYMSLERDAAHRFLSSRFDLIVVDEAQDTQSVLMPFYASIRSLPVYLIGDTYQSIYGFCGARDAMKEALELPSSVRFNLTHSFRFGTFVGDLATRLLTVAGLLEPRLRITGDEQRQTRIEIGTPSLASLNEIGSVTFIARANATIISKAFEAAAARKSVRLIGKTRETLRKVQDLLRTHCDNVADADASAAIRRRLRALKRQAAARARREYEEAQQQHHDEDVDNADTSLFNDDERDEFHVLQLILKYGVAMTRRLLRNVEQTAGSTSADVSLCTVHASKGLEFGCVALLDDFYPLHVLCHALQNQFKDDSIYGAEQYNDGKESDNGEDSAASWLDAYLRATRPTSSEMQSIDTMEQMLAGKATPLQYCKEEVHLYYVALTRATDLLYVNRNLGQLLTATTSSANNL